MFRKCCVTRSKRLRVTRTRATLVLEMSYRKSATCKRSVEKSYGRETTSTLKVDRRRRVPERVAFACFSARSTRVNFRFETARKVGGGNVSTFRLTADAYGEDRDVRRRPPEKTMSDVSTPDINIHARR